MKTFQNGNVKIEWPETKEEIENFRAGVLLGLPEDVHRAWLIAYADQLTEQCNEEEYGGVSLEELIETALSHIGGERPWGNYITRGGVFEGEGVDPAFWDHLRPLIIGEYNKDNECSFFSCSC